MQIWHGPLVNFSRHCKTGSTFFGELHQLGYRRHCVSSVPRTSNDNLNAYINEFSSIVSLLEHNCKNTVIIAGDFNINLLKLNENDIYSSYFDFLTSHSLFPQITSPTRFTRTNGTLIDNFFCKLN